MIFLGKDYLIYLANLCPQYLINVPQVQRKVFKLKKMLIKKKLNTHMMKGLSIRLALGHQGNPRGI